jgi:glycosyltransferase involved in cell wall biosynthesis
MGNRLRALLLAEAANPTWTSVPLVGWSHSQAISKLVDAHLVTQVRNRAAITEAGLVEGRDFTAIDSEAVTVPLRRLGEILGGKNGRGWTALTAAASFSNYYFERLVWKRFREQICRGAYDIVHRITPLSPTVPSLLAGKCRRAGVPFILGPLNGGVPWPKQFDVLRRREHEWLSYVRGMYRLLPGHRAALKNAAAIIVGSRDTLAQIPERFQDKCLYIPENAIDPARFGACRQRRAERPIRVVFVGRLVPYKGADMLIEAAGPLVERGLVTVEILGEGPERGRLTEMVEKMGLAGGAGRAAGITLKGWINHEELQHKLAQADVLGFPSIREFGGGVVLEAMACGVVPVVVDYAGPGELVTEGSGIRIPLGRREEIVTGLRKVLEELAQSPERIETLSGGALARARRQFTWDAKARQVLEIYQWVAGGGTKPEFPAPVPDLPQNGGNVSPGHG